MFALILDVSANNDDDDDAYAAAYDDNKFTVMHSDCDSDYDL